MNEYKSLDFLGYEGYRIYQNGTIESSWKRTGHRNFSVSNEWKILKGSKSKLGYLQVALSKKDTKIKIYLVHRLVALAFIPNPNNLPMVLHNDGNSLNNCVSNLRWGTQKDNMQDAIKHGTLVQKHMIGTNHPSNKLTESQVQNIKLLIKNNVSNIEISKQFNISQQLVSNIKTGRKWKHI